MFLPPVKVNGDGLAISGYLGHGEKFDDAVAGFGVAYADQTTKDFEEFTHAIRVGVVRAAQPKMANAVKSKKRRRAKRSVAS